MSKRVALYARVSTDDQRGNYSIPTQISESLEFVESQGYSVVGSQFVDPVTGTDRINGNGSVRAFVDDYTSRELSRPSLDAALDYLEKEGFDTLLVHSLDRLARDPYIRQTLEMEFGALGATVEYVLGNYDDSPEGEIRKDLDATFAKWENAKRVERSLRGKRGKAERGLFPSGKAPYGYTSDPDSLGGLAINEYQAGVVRRIFDLYSTQGLSIRELVSRLTSEGAVTYSGKIQWAKSSVRRILHNSAYVGTIYYNRTRRNGKARETRDKDEWINIEMPPIVDQVTFDDVQARLKHNMERRRAEPKRLYLLSGMVTCPECGRPFQAQTKKAGKNRLKNDSQSYRHRTSEGHCRNQQISTKRLDPVVWAEMVKVLLDPESLKAGYEKSLEQQEATYERQRSRLTVLHRGQDKLAKRQENLLVTYTDPDVDLKRSEFLKQRDGITKELKSSSSDISALEQELFTVAVPPELGTIKRFASEIAQQLEDPQDLTKAEKRHILKLLHIRVLIGRDEAWVEGWIDPKRRSIADGLSGRISVRCDPQRPPLRAHAWRAPGP